MKLSYDRQDQGWWILAQWAQKWILAWEEEIGKELKTKKIGKSKELRNERERGNEREGRWILAQGAKKGSA